MYERRHAALLPRRAFIGRLCLHALGCALLLLVSLVLGIAGYACTEHLHLVDAILMSSMILTGMGPTAELHTTAGKLFASAYALYSGVIFLVIFGVMAAPLFHRMLHAFHVDDNPGPQRTPKREEQSTPSASKQRPAQT